MEIREFTINDCILKEGDIEMKYHRRMNDKKITIPWGQRKLLFSELIFLIYFWDEDRYPNIKIIYAGASPGIHIPIISKFFPKIEFHLYDPRQFKIKEEEKIKIYQKYFTDEDAEYWSKYEDIIFISDIRTADYSIMTKDENEKSINIDMERQKKWYQIMKPITAHMKFRLPYSYGEQKEYLEYLDGYLFKQPWTPQTSTETRIVPYGINKYKRWDCNKYESQLFYHNKVIREDYRYLNPISKDNTNIIEPELLNDYDSSYETFIIISYLKKNNIEIKKDNIKYINEYITISLNENKKKEEWYTLELLRKDPFTIKKKFKKRNTPIKKKYH